MIEKISSQIASSVSVKPDKAQKDASKFDLEKGEKNEISQKLNESLKQNIPASENKAELLDRFSQNVVGDKLKELVNKLLDQLNANKNPNSPILKEATKLNFAPNFTGELKSLASELTKSDVFSEVLNKLESILKNPSEALKSENLSSLFKNSGVFFEAKLKDALNKELLPPSFKSLISAIKGLSSEKIMAQINELAAKDTTPKQSLDELKTIISQNKAELSQSIKTSDFKVLLKLESRLENLKDYIAKNPAAAQSKIKQIANKLLNELSNIKADFFKALNKPQNIVLENTTSLKQAGAAFEKLENTLKNIINPKSDDKILANLINKTEPNQKPNLSTAKPNLNNIDQSTQTNTPNQIVENENIEQRPSVSNSQTNTTQAKEGMASENQNNKINQNKISESENTTPNSPKDANLSKELKNNPQTIQGNENTQTDANKAQNTTQNNTDKQNPTQNQNAMPNKNTPQNPNLPSGSNATQNQNLAQNTAQNQGSIQSQNANSSQSSVQNPTQSLNSQLSNNEFLKENAVKNLAFMGENAEFNELESLNRDARAVIRKINESLKELEPNTQSAKQSLNELKGLDSKLHISLKDLPKIAQKDEQMIANEIKADVKSTLLQISNLAKNEGNEAVYNASNRLLAQIEINQLMSLANNSVNTYLPFFWDDLSDSKVVFRRGKKDKFFAQIKLEFAKLGELEVLISLNNEKYIDINIMAENRDFRRLIYENAHELKRNINKAGLLSANFFVGDIIRSKFDPRKLKNLDIQMGINKSV